LRAAVQKSPPPLPNDFPDVVPDFAVVLLLDDPPPHAPSATTRTAPLIAIFTRMVILNFRSSSVCAPRTL
jgi:hypothetical protein